MFAVPRFTTCFLLAMVALLASRCAGQLDPDGTSREEDETGDWSIVVHGGAGSSPATFTRPENEARRAGIEAALRLGVAKLKQKATALETVEVVIRNLEDNSLFNAGKGAVYNAEGGHELDASIMSGRDLSCGAVAGVSIVKHPISLARLVMTETKHVLFAGQGADAFAKKAKVELVENEYFDTSHQREAWEESRAPPSQEQSSHPSEKEKIAIPNHRGTVGCVVRDSRGNIAAGTSTGGLTGKKFGRVGDSPIVGAGTYADNSTCGVSCTGIGEHFIRHSVAYDVSARLRYGGQSLTEAVRVILHDVLKPGWGGLIAIDQDGKMVMDFNTEGMAAGAANSNGVFEVRWDVNQSRRKRMEETSHDAGRHEG